MAHGVPDYQGGVYSVTGDAGVLACVRHGQEWNQTTGVLRWTGASYPAHGTLLQESHQGNTHTHTVFG